MNTKTKALSIITIIAIAAVAATLAYTMQTTVSAQTNNTTNAVADQAVTSPSSSPLNNQNSGGMNFAGGFGGPEGGFGGPGMMMTEQGNFSGPGAFGRCGRGGFVQGGFGQIEVSSEFTANVTAIAKADSDVANLLNSGYNITAVHPIVQTTIDGNGNVVTKALNAELLLESSNGRATVLVSLDQAKVTKIVTLTMTVIEK